MVIFFINCFILYRFILRSAKLRQFSLNHLWMPLKMWFEHVVSNYITCKPRRCLTTFSEYIIGGQGFLQKNMYQMQISPSICWYNHLLFSCIFLYSCVLSPKNSCFCPPKCPRDKKGQKKIRPSIVWGTNEGQNWFFGLCLL